MNELKQIPGYEGLYAVNESGQVYSFRTGRMLTLRPNSNGYLRADLYKHSKRDQRLVHRLVAEMFLPNSEGKKEINHKNGNRADNRLSNLEWCTRSENLKHSFANGREHPMTGKFGALHHNSQAIKCINNGVVYGSQREAARALDLCYKQINSALTGKQLHVKGYKFEKA